ncbi:MAG: zinc-dependent peptidase [Bacteroidota bacterium]|nr:zinc-dependent peptidase [Bacteroidota bacterium]
MNHEEIGGFYVSLALVILFVVFYYVRFKYFFKGPFGGGIKKEDLRHVLIEHFIYYKRLSSGDKVKFENRVLHFIQIKEFIPRQIPKVTVEMKVLIAACCVQLTFGFPSVHLEHFKRILIYPDSYYSTINRTYHKGEVNPRGRLIVLSWKSFVSGYINPTDSINLGLHEMAHALKLENKIQNNEYRFLDPQLLQKWQSLSSDSIKAMKRGEIDFFRKYAEVNEDEFFAVAIENFFEKPAEFKEQLPELYGTMTGLLRQNPLEILN